MQAKDKFLEKINFLILIFSLCLTQSLYATKIYEEVFNYNDSLKNSSVNFIQTTDQYVQEGEIFFGNKRIKIDYNTPQKITIILSEKKGMYINHQLKESDFFLTDKTYIKIFFDIFHNKNYIKNMTLEEIGGQINISKDIIMDSSMFNIKLTYENNPIKLRRLEISSNEEQIQMGFFNHIIEEVFNKKIFSMVDPYLN